MVRSIRKILLALILAIFLPHAVIAQDDSTKISMKKIYIAVDNPAQKEILESLIGIRDQQSPAIQLETNIEQLISYLENNGYPFSQVQIDSMVLNNNRELDAYLSVIMGPLITIDRIKITGNKITNENVIRRETRIQRGEVYNQEKVSKIPGRLLKLGFFKQVDEPQIVMNDKGKGELILQVVEGNMNNVDGVVGYNPGKANQKGFFTGLIDIALANLLGTGRRVEAYWEKKDIKTQQLRFLYREPWFLGFPIMIGGSFQQLIQDTSYIKRNWTLDFSLPLSDNVMLFTNFGREQISPDSIGTVLWNIPKSKSWLLNVGVTYDTRNEPLNPRKGIFYQTTVEFGRKKIDPLFVVAEKSASKTSFNRKRITTDIELFIPTLKWQVISLALHGRQVTSNEAEISISDIFRFGGSKSLRGYREDELLGSTIAWLNAEYRYLLSRYSRVFLFFDSGYHTRRSLTEGKLEDYKFGYGFGIRLDTRLGIMGLDYGLAKGRSLTNGLVHVRLVNQF